MSIALLMGQRILIPVPELNESQKLGALIGKELMGLVCGTCHLHRTLAGVLAGHRRCNDGEFLERVLVLGG